jgi:hypothetical protein
MPRIGRAVVATLAVVVGAVAGAVDPMEIPDQEMLEFLGSWEAEDEDWLAMSMEELTLEEEQAEADDEAAAEAMNDER